MPKSLKKKKKKNAGPATRNTRATTADSAGTITNKKNYQLIGMRVEYINWPCLAILKSKIVGIKGEAYRIKKKYSFNTKFLMENGDTIARKDIIESKKDKEIKENKLKNERIKINTEKIWGLLYSLSSTMNKIQKDRGE